MGMMRMARYRTKDGDMLDWICFQYYSQESGAVEAVLEANPGLAKLGPVFPAGTIIELPTLPNTSQKGTVRLWN